MTPAMTTASQFVTIINKKGLHARASNAFASLAGTFKSDIRVRHEGEEAKALHIMDLLMLVAHKGCEIEICAEGIDADAAVAGLVDLVEDGFGELAADQAAEEGELPPGTEPA